MQKIYFVSHPEVIINPKIPVPEWDISETGTNRVKKLLKKPWIKSIGYVYSSAEIKALSTAQIIAHKLGLKVTNIRDLGEINRSATGYLKPKEFEKVVDLFFTNPKKNIKGWEKAVEAQQRIIKAIRGIIKETYLQTNIGIISHGGVGALLLCYLKNMQISRNEDQPGEGGGNYFVFTKQMELIQSWESID